MTSPSEVQRLLKLAAEIRTWAEPPMSGSRLDELLELAAKEIERLARDVPHVTAALAELVRLKELKEWARSGAHNATEAARAAALAEHETFKAGAWDAARRALAEYEGGART